MLELVLSLPILLFVMGLMIVLGTGACFKLRGLPAGRDAVWRARFPRSPGDLPQSATWAAPATMSVSGAGKMTELDDPAINLPVVRGPFGFPVDADLLDPTKGLVSGNADLERPYPVFRRWRGYDFELRHLLLDNAFQYQRTRLAWNWQRRLPVLYTLPQADGALSAAYQEAVLAIKNAPFRPDLDPLDNDPEIRAFYGSTPDFHPRIGGCFSLDPAAVRANEVEQLIWRIKGNCMPRVESVAEVMTNYFISMYQQELALPTTPPARRAELTAKIAQLQAFLGTLAMRCP